jgi:hypothetical protein
LVKVYPELTFSSFLFVASLNFFGQALLRRKGGCRLEHKGIFPCDCGIGQLDEATMQQYKISAGNHSLNHPEVDSFGSTFFAVVLNLVFC